MNTIRSYKATKIVANTATNLLYISSGLLGLTILSASIPSSSLTSATSSNDSVVDEINNSFTKH